MTGMGTQPPASPASAIWLAGNDTGIVESMTPDMWRGTNMGMPQTSVTTRTYDAYGWYDLLDLLGRRMWSAMGDAWRATAKAVGAQRSEAFIDVLDGDAEDVTRAWAPLHARESSGNGPWIRGRSDIVCVVHADDETARWPFSMHCRSGTVRARSWACRT